MHKSADRIRNVALIGHRGSGKTSLHEALLFEARATNRLGSVLDGTTVSDSEPDEQARKMSISLALSSFEWDDRKINLIDTPGEPSFVADALGSMRVCESAVFVVNGVMGVEVTTRRLWARAEELDLARMIFVNMLDRERADFYPHARLAQGGLRRARRRDGDPDRRRARDLRRHRPHRHEGLLVLRPARAERRQLHRDPDPRRHAGDRGGVPREAHGRDLRGQRQPHGALPRGRGDRARRDRGGAERWHEPRLPVPGDLRRRDAQPRDEPPPGRDRRGPSVAREARRARAARDHARAPRRRAAVRLRLQDPRRPVRGPDQPLPGLPGAHAATTRTS